jgi:copper oxidase (laccase) domain-containing protein
MVKLASNTSGMTFEGLEGLGEEWAHRLLLRHPSVEVAVEREEAVARLRPWHLEQVGALGFEVGRLMLAEQVHGAEVALVDEAVLMKGAGLLPGVDGLVTNLPGVVLGIYVADCCAVYLVDAEVGSFGLVHSGKKGSEENIVGVAIELMVAAHGAVAERIKVQLSPCIRPPMYEVDFAAQIRKGALEAGVREENLGDSGICTASDQGRFYSYRMEKGRTGRMLALLGRRESHLHKG